MSNKQIKSEKERLAQEIAKLSPMQKACLEQGLFGKPDPNEFVRAMNYGGDYHIDDDRKIVEMYGDFSKADLIKIAQVMID